MGRTTASKEDGENIPLVFKFGSTLCHAHDTGGSFYYCRVQIRAFDQMTHMDWIKADLAVSSKA